MMQLMCFQGKKVELKIDDSIFKTKKWCATHPWEIENLESFFVIAKLKFSRILEVAQDRANLFELNRRINEEIAPRDDKHIMTPDEIKQLIDIIEEFYQQLILNP